MKIKPGYQLLFLAFLALGVYYPTLFAPLNSLDDITYFQLLLNQEGFSLSGHFRPGGTYDYFRPLLTLSFEIDKHVGGLHESFMHLFNILLHTANVLLIFGVARVLCRFSGVAEGGLPFVAAAIFCLHPINSEAVNWISGRSDVLAGFFVFSAVIAVLKALERRSLTWGVASAVFFFAGTLCKETGLFLLPGILLMMVWRPTYMPPAWPRRWSIPVFYAVGVTAYFLLRWRAYQFDRGLGQTVQVLADATGSVAPDVTSAIAPAAITPASFPILDALRVIVKVSGFYAVKLVQPLPLNFAIHRIDPLYLFPGCLLLIVLVVLAWRRRPAGVILVTSASLATAALVVVFTQLAWTPVAERYMYIPCGTFAVGLAVGCGPWFAAWQRRSLATVGVSLLLAVGAWTTVTRNIVWQDNLTLYQDTVSKSPDYALAKNQLALALIAHNRREEAIAIMDSIRVPHTQRASLNRAVVLVEQGQFDDARRFLLERQTKHDHLEIQSLEMLITITTDMINDTGDQAKKRLHYLEIIGWLERLEQLTRNPFNWYRLGRIHLWLGHRSEAQRCFAEAARRLPETSIYRQPAAKLACDLATGK